MGFVGVIAPCGSERIPCVRGRPSPRQRRGEMFYTQPEKPQFDFYLDPRWWDSEPRPQAGIKLRQESTNESFFRQHEVVSYPSSAAGGGDSEPRPQAGIKLRQKSASGSVYRQLEVTFRPSSAPIAKGGRFAPPFCFGAGGGTRTHTMSPSTDFESVTSTNSITPACEQGYYSRHGREMQGLFFLPPVIRYIKFKK